MSRQERIYVHDIPAIPDCTHHRLVTLCGGDVRGHVFGAAEHLLRMLANFREGQITLAIRFLFDPDTRAGLQRRLRLQVAVRAGEGLSEDTVRQLINSGPLAEFYDLKALAEVRDSFDLPLDFPAICEVIRQEQRGKPLVPKEQNPGRIPKLYYSLSPLEAREDNDYSMVDSLLSRMAQPCVIEMVVSPVDQSPELEAQYKYITRLMSVNQYGDEPRTSVGAPSFIDEEAPDREAVLTPERKRDPMADDIAREHQDLHRTLRHPQLLFNVKAFAMTEENALMLASAVAESGLCSGKYSLLAYCRDKCEVSAKWVEASHKGSRAVAISLDALHPKIWDDDLPRGYRAMSRLCRMGTVEELKGLVRLPVGGHGSPRCIRKSTDPEEQDCTESLLIGDDMEGYEPKQRAYSKKDFENLGRVFSCEAPTRLEQRLSLEGLTKHMFVAGVPGSGKTTAVYNMLVQLARHKIPFLVIEPAKTEYRILKTLRNHEDPAVSAMAKRLRVYSPGNDKVSPFRFNPLAYPAGISQEEHIGQILACFDAAMPMGGPLQALIAEAIEGVYEGLNEAMFPQMTDLAEAAAGVMERKNYAGEIRSNLQAAIEVRLGLLTRRAMGRIFKCGKSIPDTKELLAHPTIIEMDYLSQDHACLLTLFLLAAIREEIRTDPHRRGKGLCHVTVIEEAHNIVGRSGSAKASEEIADPKAFAAQYVSRMLAELRALGEGIIIADQLPSAVAPEVVRNTGTKLAHRLVSNEDRQDLGGAMLLGDVEIEDISRLSPGEAYFYTEGLHRPRRVRCLNANEYLRLGDYPDNASIISHIDKDDWFFLNRPDSAQLFLTRLRESLGRAKDAIKAAGRLDKAIEDFANHRDSSGAEGHASLEGDRQALLSKVRALRRNIDDSLRTCETLAATGEEQGKRYSDGFAKGLTRLIAEWRDDKRPILVALTQKLKAFESQISKDQGTLNSKEKRT